MRLPLLGALNPTAESRPTIHFVAGFLVGAVAAVAALLVFG